MDLESRLELIRQVGEEIVTEDELRHLLHTKAKPTAYDGFEPSGKIHVAQGIVRAINTNKMIKAGVHFKFFVADWHAWANNKMGGDLEKIQTVGKYFIEVWRSAGMDLDNVEFVWGSDLARDENYWKKVMQIARSTTVSRIVRCGQIMGRKESEVMQASQILYPCMQCADIFQLKADITQLGMDQRKVNVLAREIGPKMGYWKPVIVSHHMLMGLMPPKHVTEDYSETTKTIRMFPLSTKGLLSRFEFLKANNFADDSKIIGVKNEEWLKEYRYDIKKRIYDESERIKEKFERNPSELNSLLREQISIIMAEIVKLDTLLNKRLLLDQNIPKLQFDERTKIGEYVQTIGNMIMELNNSIDEEIRSKSFEKKMSKSIPDSSVFMTDSPAEIKRKIEKAYCPAKTVHENPLAEYMKYIIFEKFPTVRMERPAKFGGDLELESYREFARLYEEGKIHPADVKQTVARHLNEILEPVRKHFQTNSRARELEEFVRKQEVTR